jgi:hypothetical protein
MTNCAHFPHFCRPPTDSASLWRTRCRVRRFGRGRARGRWLLSARELPAKQSQPGGCANGRAARAMVFWRAASELANTVAEASGGDSGGGGGCHGGCGWNARALPLPVGEAQSGHPASLAGSGTVFSTRRIRIARVLAALLHMHLYWGPKI